MLLVWADGRVHYKPEMLTAKEREGSFEIESIPVPEKIPGKVPVEKIDMVAKKVWYEYVDAPETDPEVLSLRLGKLEKATGVGSSGQKGIAQRIDNLEARLQALEAKVV